MWINHYGFGGVYGILKFMSQEPFQDSALGNLYEKLRREEENKGKKGENGESETENKIKAVETLHAFPSSIEQDLTPKNEERARFEGGKEIRAESIDFARKSEDFFDAFARSIQGFKDALLVPRDTTRMARAIHEIAEAYADNPLYYIEALKAEGFHWRSIPEDVYAHIQSEYKAYEAPNLEEGFRVSASRDPRGFIENCMQDLYDRIFNLVREYGTELSGDLRLGINEFPALMIAFVKRREDMLPEFGKFIGTDDVLKSASGEHDTGQDAKDATERVPQRIVKAPGAVFMKQEEERSHTTNDVRSERERRLIRLLTVEGDALRRFRDIEDKRASPTLKKMRAFLAAEAVKERLEFEERDSASIQKEIARLPKEVRRCCEKNYLRTTTVRKERKSIFKKAKDALRELFFKKRKNKGNAPVLDEELFNAAAVLG